MIDNKETRTLLSAYDGDEDALTNSSPSETHSQGPSMGLDSHLEHSHLVPNLVSFSKPHDSVVAIDDSDHAIEPRLAYAFPPKLGTKRPASDDDSDREQQQSLLSCQSPQTTHSVNRQFLACPFYKMDSQKYSDCRHNTLRRIKDVKQHVYRKHQKPNFYCPLCFQIFNNATLRDEHIQLKSCVIQSDPIYDGISEDQRRILSQCPSRGKTPGDQWCDMWKVIFPKIDPPKSPYLGSHREEMVSEIRSFWRERKSEILSETIKTEGASIVDHALLAQVMERLLDRFELEPSGAVFPSHEACSPPFAMDSVPGPRAIQKYDHNYTYTDRPWEPWISSLPDAGFTGNTCEPDSSPESIGPFDCTAAPFLNTTAPSIWTKLDTCFDMGSQFSMDGFVGNSAGFHSGGDYWNNPNPWQIEQFAA